MPCRDDELSLLLKRLARPRRVYVRSGQLPAPTGGTSGVRAAVAAEVHTLVGHLWQDWHRYATDPAGPASAEQVEAALESFTAQRAAELMGRLAAECLVWPGAALMERAEADAVARRAVELLGPDARWWTTYDQELEGSCTGVSACTFDGLVTGTDGHRFIALIQIGED